MRATAVFEKSPCRWSGGNADAGFELSPRRSRTELSYSDCVSRLSGEAPGDSVVQTACVVDVPGPPLPPAPPRRSPLAPPVPPPVPSPIEPTQAAMASPGARSFTGESHGLSRRTMPH